MSPSPHLKQFILGSIVLVVSANINAFEEIEPGVDYSILSKSELRELRTIAVVEDKQIRQQISQLCLDKIQGEPEKFKKFAKALERCRTKEFAKIESIQARILKKRERRRLKNVKHSQKNGGQ